MCAELKNLVLFKFCSIPSTVENFFFFAMPTTRTRKMVTEVWIVDETDAYSKLVRNPGTKQVAGVKTCILSCMNSLYKPKLLCRELTRYSGKDPSLSTASLSLSPPWNWKLLMWVWLWLSNCSLFLQRWYHMLDPKQQTVQQKQYT